MSLEEDLRLKLKNNQHTAFITDADDLLAAWRHRREKTSGSRCFDIQRPVRLSHACRVGVASRRVLESSLRPDHRFKLCQLHATDIELGTDPPDKPALLLLQAVLGQYDFEQQSHE